MEGRGGYRRGVARVGSRTRDFGKALLLVAALRYVVVFVTERLDFGVNFDLFLFFVGLVGLERDGGASGPMKRVDISCPVTLCQVMRLLCAFLKRRFCPSLF